VLGKKLRPRPFFFSFPFRGRCPRAFSEEESEKIRAPSFSSFLFSPFLLSSPPLPFPFLLFEERITAPRHEPKWSFFFFFSLPCGCAVFVSECFSGKKPLGDPFPPPPSSPSSSPVPVRLLGPSVDRARCSRTVSFSQETE